MVSRLLLRAVEEKIWRYDNYPADHHIIYRSRERATDVHCRKPEIEIYRMALDIAQVDPAEVVYIDDQELFVEVAQGLGLHGIHHTDYAATRAALAALGLTLLD